MIEIINHEVYDLLKREYDEVCLDYVIFSAENEIAGIETHRKAVINAFDILNKRFADYDLEINIMTDKMTAEKISINDLLRLPEDSCYDSRRKRNRSYNMPVPMTYWFAFLEPPHGTPYLKDDFIRLNSALFPDREDVEVFRWNDDFSNYFDAGKEWWGTGLWTAFDLKNKVITVIGASLTD